MGQCCEYASLLPRTFFVNDGTRREELEGRRTQGSGQTRSAFFDCRSCSGWCIFPHPLGIHVYIFRLYRGPSRSLLILFFQGKEENELSSSSTERSFLPSSYPFLSTALLPPTTTRSTHIASYASLLLLVSSIFYRLWFTGRLYPPPSSLELTSSPSFSSSSLLLLTFLGPTLRDQRTGSISTESRVQARGSRFRYVLAAGESLFEAREERL